MSEAIRVLVPDGTNYRFSWKVETMAKGGAFAVVVPEVLTEEGVVAAADYLILAVPHTPETENLLSRQRIARMKSTASVINVGRGRLIDEDALCAVLRDGRLAMAGLDVFRWEPLPQSSPLLALPNVVLSPHMGGGSSERYWEADVAGALENIRCFFAGEKTSGELAS